MPTHLVYEVNEDQFELVYDALSMTLAAMMATTLFLWFRVSSIHEKYKTALVISGLVTFIAAYNYVRIFDSWKNAYAFPEVTQNEDGDFVIGEPHLTGTPFNDAFRYMDWLLTVPLLLMEIVLVMKLDKATAFRKNMQLGSAAAIMVVIGYPGELVMDPNELQTRWAYWAAAMVPFVYIVYELTIGLSGALNEEEDDTIRSKIWWAQRITIISWLTYPVVYIIPMLGGEGATCVVGIQVGYCISDIISKCLVGIMIYRITAAKSLALAKGKITSDSPLVEA